ncbi:MAG: phosphoglycerate kinase [Candidatus Marinimicrobia bacterium]|nr:phosphoglycerate kinase [Candidatus Neomarinimicrobiota bacterium]
MTILSLDELELSDKRILMRVDFNVPISSDGAVEDDFRIRSVLPSIEKVIKDSGSLILMSHLGRPGGKPVPELSLKPVADSLSKMLGSEVKFVPDCVGSEALSASLSLKPGELLLLENLRFHPGETDNDSDFAQSLAINGDIYVNDAFGAAHRAHASTVGVADFLQPAAAGYLMQNELKYLSELMRNPEGPMAVILGGAKVSDKIPVIENLSSLADKFLIGGGLAYTFLKANGLPIGKSLHDDSMLERCKSIMDQLKNKGVELYLPSDCVAVKDIESMEVGDVCFIDELADDEIAVDIGPMTVAEFDHVLDGIKTVVWNGPMGVFEVPHWSNGTVSIGKKLAELTKSGATTIVGGGDTAAALNQLGLSDGVTHISTGGGASLELLSGKSLPGIEALRKKA